VTIHHYPVVTVICDGEEVTATVEEGTVYETLSSLNISLGEEDIVSPDGNDLVTDGMKITVSRVTYEYSYEEVEIPYETEYVTDNDVFIGIEETTTEGVNGTKKITYKTTYVDGVPEATDVYDEEVTIEPVNEVITQGTRQVGYTEALTASVDTDNKTITTETGETYTYSKVIKMTATAYTYYPGENITSSGVPVQVGVVAALPSTLPQGTKVYIVSPYGTWEYGFATVGDKPARDILDLFMEEYDDCIQFGVKDAMVYILDTSN
jgi:3D (Asp-Asp-Asp) domain-containing protein